MPSSIVLLLVGLLAPGLSLPFPSGLQDTAYKKDEPVAPDVHLLHSSRNPRDSADSVRLTCNPSGNSEDVYITSLENGEPKPLSPNTELRWKNANEQNVSTNNTLFLFFNEFLIQISVSCQATHAPTSTNMERQARKRRAYKKDEPVVPEVRLLHSSHKLHVALMCEISSIYSDGVNITWLENGKPKPLSPNTEHRWKDANGQNFSTTSTLYIPYNEWMEENTFSCQVTPKPTSTKKESQARKRRELQRLVQTETGIREFMERCMAPHFPETFLAGDSNPGVKVYTQRPNPEDLYLEKSAKFTCVMSKEKLAASWSQGNPGTLTTKTLEVRTQSNGTIITIIQATASIRDEKDGETFTCKVEPPQELAGPEGEKTG